MKIIVRGKKKNRETRKRKGVRVKTKKIGGRRERKKGEK